MANDIKEKKIGIGSIILVTILLSGIVAGLGWYIGVVISKKFVNNGKAQTILMSYNSNNKEGAKENKDNKVILSSLVVALPPILTNINDRPQGAKDDIWVRAQIALVIKKGEVIDETDKAKIVNSFLSYFRTINMSSLQGATGLMYIKDDLLDRARVIAGDKVLQILISSLLVQGLDLLGDSFNYFAAMRYRRGKVLGRTRGAVEKKVLQILISSLLVQGLDLLGDSFNYFAAMRYRRGKMLGRTRGAVEKKVLQILINSLLVQGLGLLGDVFNYFAELRSRYRRKEKLVRTRVMVVNKVLQILISSLLAG